MKYLLRNFLINFAALVTTTKLIPGFVIDGGIKSYFIGSLGLMVLNMAVIPLLKVMFLPLNILTLGLFTWAINVIAIYILTTTLPAIKIMPYQFAGANLGTIIIPTHDLTTFQVAILVSLLVGFIARFLEWIAH